MIVCAFQEFGSTIGLLGQTHTGSNRNRLFNSGADTGSSIVDVEAVKSSKY